MIGRPLLQKCNLCGSCNASRYSNLLRRRSEVVNSNPVIPVISERNSENIDSTDVITNQIEEHNQDDSSVDGITILLTAKQENDLFNEISLSYLYDQLDRNGTIVNNIQVEGDKIFEAAGVLPK